ncbi:MAG: Ig domain-containing protein [Verrucomicrobiales bacterium]|nr:Ig domain-containing protein [Verrucomicrobiales bacterium]
MAAEYFFEGRDKGAGANTPLAAVDGAFDEIDEEAELEITIPNDLPLGPHKLYVRMLSKAGVWSTPRAHPIIVEGQRKIIAAEYYLDDPTRQPDVRGTNIPVPADSAWDEPEELLDGLEIDTANLSVGTHTLYLRAQDQDKQWGPARSFTFEVLAPPVVSSAEYQITDASATEPNADRVWVAMSGLAFETLQSEIEGEIDTSGLARGAYKVWVRSKDREGRTDQPKNTKFAEFAITQEIERIRLVADQIARPGNLLSLRVEGGANGAFEPLTGAPSGLTLNTDTGQISWTPAANAVASTNRVTVRYLDQGIPPLRTSASFTVFVEPASSANGPALVSAYNLSGSGQADLLFSRPLDLATAGDLANYRVNGSRPSQVAVGADGRSVSLASLGISSSAGDTFSLSISGLKDSLGTPLAANIESTGSVLSLRKANLGGAQTELGAAFPLGPEGARISGSGSGFSTRLDAASFVYEEVTGDFEIRVQVTDLLPTDYLSVAGLLARENTAAEARSFSAVAPGWVRCARDERDPGKCGD